MASCTPLPSAIKAAVMFLLMCLMNTMAWAFVHHSNPIRRTGLSQSLPITSLASSFFDDFEDMAMNNDDDDEDEDEEDDEDEDDDDDDDDEYADLDDKAVADFRSKMGSLFGDDPTVAAAEPVSDSSTEEVDDLIRRATNQKEEESTDWATPEDNIQAGVILIANPEKFCADFGSKISSPSTSLLSKFGLTLPPPADLGPDRRADLLPVLCVLEKNPLRGAQAFLLNRRTGYLLGDLEQQEGDDDATPPPPPRLGAFMIQPLWFGGTSAGGNEESSSSSSGLDMLHQCPDVNGAKPLTEDGLFWGGDPVQAQDAMSESEDFITGFDFKFFVQSTRWLPLQLEKEVRDGTWFCARVSKEVLFKPRDRMGTRRAKPLWTEIMELLGGDYIKIRDALYADDAGFP